jgi:protein-S-isoprenylcysteine O-methyltransferase Ste14
MFILIRALVYATLFIGFVLIALPASLVGWSTLVYPAAIKMPQVFGAASVVTGAAITVWCVATFVFVGRGTPAPFDPPRRLVDRGPYAFVRNPMYWGAALAVGGAGLFYESRPLLAYVAGFLTVMHLMIVFYEEPTLRNTFGAAYDDYCRRVGRWMPMARFTATGV